MIIFLSKQGGKNMSKRKNKKNKNKVIKLTDEQYGAYISALKDEKPPMLIAKNQKES